MASALPRRAALSPVADRRAPPSPETARAWRAPGRGPAVPPPAPRPGCHPLGQLRHTRSCLELGQVEGTPPLASGLRHTLSAPAVRPACLCRPATPYRQYRLRRHQAHPGLGQGPAATPSSTSKTATTRPNSPAATPIANSAARNATTRARPTATSRPPPPRPPRRLAHPPQPPMPPRLATPPSASSTGATPPV